MDLQIKAGLTGPAALPEPFRQVMGQPADITGAHNQNNVSRPGLFKGCILQLCHLVTDKNGAAFLLPDPFSQGAAADAAYGLLPAE